MEGMAMSKLYDAMGEEIHPSDAQEAAYLRLRRRYGFIIGFYAATAVTVLFVGAVLIVGDVWHPDWLPLLVATALGLWTIGLLTHIWFAYMNSPITYDDANEAAMHFAHRHGPPSTVDVHGDWPMGQTQTWTWAYTWQIRRTKAGYELYRLKKRTQEWRWEGTLATAVAALATAVGIENRSPSEPPSAQAR